MKPAQVFIATAAAVIVLGFGASTSAAGRFSTSHQSFRATFASWEIGGLFGTTTCALTLEGSLHSRTISKVVGTLIGYITSARSGACASLTAAVLTETLPWHLRYGAFTGSLPGITAIRTNIVGYAFSLRETGGITCLVRSTEGEPATLTYTREGSGGLISATLGGAIRSAAECFGARFTIGGSSNSLANEAGSRITITLI